MEIKPRVLVVEPDAATRKLIVGALKASDAEPEPLASGQQADSLVQKEKFDGIFLDWGLADVVPRELVKRIRQSRWNYATPIVAMAKESDREAMSQSFKEGVTFFLSKPLSAGKVQRLLAVSRGLILEERRRFQRVSLAVPVNCEHKQESRKGRSVDLSTRGMLVKTDKPCPPDSDVQLSFTLPAEREIPLQPSGRVMRVTPAQEMGIRFQRLSADDRKQIADFVEATLEKLRARRPQ
ncbi:MAG: PilZ domain-containing protein [Candidatus Acidoferrales bacterium]